MKTVVEGDLLDYFEEGKCQAIAHCCNCQGVMGSGIALQIKHRFVDAYQAYKAYEEKSGLTLGSVSAASYPILGSTIYNLHAQDLFNKPGETVRCVDYEALYASLKIISNHMDSGILGIPYKMAADRAGGDWNIVEAMIDSVFPEDGNVDILIVKYKPTE